MNIMGKEKVSTKIKGIILVTIAASLWGISGTVAQYLFQQRGFTTEGLVEIRLSISGVILVLYSCIKYKGHALNIWKTRYSRWKLIVFGIFGMLGVQYTYFSTIRYGNAATATILQFLSPVIITLYLVIRSRKVPGLKEIVAITFAMVGTFFMITKGNFQTLAISELELFWGIASAFAAAFYTLQPRSLLYKWNSTIVVGWGLLIGGVVFGFIHQPWNITGIFDASSIVAIIFVIIFGTVIPFYCYLDSIKYIKPTEASILSSVEPLSAAVVSVVWLHVSLGLPELIGGLLIIFTIITLSKKEKVT